MFLYSVLGGMGILYHNPRILSIHSLKFFYYNYKKTIKYNTVTSAGSCTTGYDMHSGTSVPPCFIRTVCFTNTRQRIYHNIYDSTSYHGAHHETQACFLSNPAGTSTPPTRSVGVVIIMPAVPLCVLCRKGFQCSR